MARPNRARENRDSRDFEGVNMAIVYRDRTFCVNQSCKKRCERFLTPQIEQAAEAYGLPVAVSEFICLNQGEEGVYRYEEGETNETMS